MTDKLSGTPRPIGPRLPLGRPDVRGMPPQKGAITQGADFQSILETKLQATRLKFSRHAEARMRLRNVELEEAQLAKLENAVKLADTKGARESLIVMGDNVFVVSVKNKTVITVMDRALAKDNVFTQIDSAVLTD